MKKLFEIARIDGAHGIRGEVLLTCFLESPEDIIRYNPLTTAQGESLEISVSGMNKKRLIAAISGIENRNQSELMRGKLYAELDKLPDVVNDDEYYTRDLLGMEVALADGVRVGKVIGIHNFGAGDIMEIEKEGGDCEYLSFDRKTVKTIDKNSGTITVSPPENL